MLLLVLLAFALGAAGLNADMLWRDEIYTLANIGAFDPPYSPMQVIESLAEWSPDQGPLFFVLASQWARLVGWSQVPMRYFSLLCGALLIAWTYRLAVTVFDRRTALAACFFLSTSGMAIWYTHELRMYTLWPTLIVIHFWLYWRLVSGCRAGKGTWVAFAATAAAAMYTQIFSVFAIAGLGIQHLIFARNSPRWRSILSVWAIGAFVYVPQMPVFLEGLRGYTSEESIARQVALSAIEVTSLLAQLAVNDVLLTWLPLVILGTLTIAWRNDRAASRLLTVAVIAVGGIILANTAIPLISGTRVRYFVAMIPVFAILTGRFLFALDRWFILGAPLLLLWTLGAVRLGLPGEAQAYFGSHELQMDHPPLHRYADALQGRIRPHDYLLGFAGSSMIGWRYKHGWTTADWYTMGILGIEGGFISTYVGETELLDNLAKSLDSQPYVLLIYDPQNAPPGIEEILKVIEAEYIACEIVVDADDIFVQRYVNHLIECDHRYSPIHYDNGIGIVDKFAAYDAAKQSVQVVTRWKVDDGEILEQFNFSIQLITRNGEMRRQLDEHLYATILKWHVAEISTEGLAPGEYRAVIIVYDRYSSSSKLNGIDLATGEAGTILPVLHFTIEERK